MKPNLLKHAYATFVAMFITMLSMPAMAQSEGKARIILEAHNVWSDGSGYQMLLDADHNLYGDKIPAEGPIWDDKNPPANLYDGFEYKIPAQADPSTTPKYMVMDGEDYVDIPAVYTISVSLRLKRILKYGLRAMLTALQGATIITLKRAKPIVSRCIS